MGSLADELFADYGAAMLLQYHADAEPITYTPTGGAPIPLRAIIRDVKTREVYRDSLTQEVKAVEIVVHRDPSSEWGGIANPDLSGLFEFHGFLWRQQRVDNEAVDAQSQTFQTITVRRTSMVSVGHPGRVREAE